MLNIYDATDTQKKQIIDIENESLIYRKRNYRPTIEDLVLIRQTNVLPIDGIVHPTDVDEQTNEHTSSWTLNGARLSNKDFVIIEPFEEQINNPNLANLNELDTRFTSDVKLSKKAIILVSEETYRILCGKNLSFKEQAKKLGITLYRGDQALALKMLLNNKRFTYFDLDENGFIPADEYGDTLEYIEQLKKLEEQVAIELQKIGINITYGKKHEYNEDIESAQNKRRIVKKTEAQETPSNSILYMQPEEEQLYIENIKELSSQMITGLTPKVEGDIELDGECYATTTIGKVRENQEDAVLLIKDNQIPQFKMIAVADGMGGEQKGELASHIIVIKLKEWFENLSNDEKEEYFKDVTKMEEILKGKIQEISFDVDWHLYGFGGATLVCAVIGENNTIVANVGDSRGYIIKDGKLKQVTIDDAIVQDEFEKGNIPFKDAMRFHSDANGITQAVGMGLIDNIHTKNLNNSDYDILLLFSDGVTDCLSEEDIAVICRTTDRKEVAKMIAKKAIEHDSIAEESLIEDYVDFNFYIPGGKDNTTAAIFAPEKDEEER